MAERRAHVRVRPAADYDVRVELREGMFSVRLSVTDLSVGGMGLVVDEMFADKKSGAILTFSIALPEGEPFEAKGEVRYTSQVVGGKCGVAWVGLADEEQARISRAVAELLERGHSA
ncbi:MAG: hypothetical protein B6A08_08060 [Sorangiineae bacterium NIC37A_2]|jgi:c-di-GMP-binding flagellar brake protein YcgR|nr:MAG: hypothetical protein B6A08_08060 [Sorangiineae bacterium NIC37A_2]